MKCEACEHENIDGARFCAGCGALLPTHHEGDDPMVGQLIGGRYRVVGVLGEGGMGIVYIGEQQMGSTVRKVAIKTLHQHLSKDSSVLARFHRECGTVAQLEHPNTIKFYDFGATEDGTLYIAMEFVEGKPLSDIIEADGALPPDRAVHIMRQIAGALDEAHEMSIIHRDLKPENVILGRRAGEKDFVKVLDFGIAARTESADQAKEQKLTQQGMVLGTPPYMSPEQFTGKALDRRSDIYSLGVMAYEMLTGQLPFEADTPWQWATEHMTAQPRPFEAIATAGNIPPAMRQAIMKALSKDPDQRQATARQFFEELTEGGRVTVESATGSGGKISTAAMEAAPDFGAPNYGPPPTPMGAAPHAAAAIPAPPTTSGRQAGGGKGLLIGLGTLGAVLLVAMVVVGLGSMQSEEEDAPPLDLVPTAGSTPQPVEIDAQLPPDEQGATSAGSEDMQAGEPDKVAQKTPPKTTQGSTAPKTTSGSTEKPKQTDGSGDGGKSTSGGDAPKPAGGACAACEAAARSGNFAAAASNFSSCADPALKQRCQTLIRSRASGAALSAANSGNCAQARAIIAVTTKLGIQSGQLSSAAAKCP